MRFVIILCVLLGSLRVASADSDLIVLGPVGADVKVPAKLVEAVRAALAKTGLPVSTKSIDSTCATDAGCLVAAGGDAHAKQALAIAVGGTSKNGISLDIVLVDVVGKEQIARRDLAIPEARLGKDLGAKLKLFLDQAPIERAKALFEDGNQHYNLGEFAPALELYKRAYRIKSLPAFLFNIAQCHRKLGQHQEAITMYQSYLVGIPDAANKKLVESLIKESRDQLAEQQRIADQTAKLEEDRLSTEKKKAEDERLAKEAEATAAQQRAEQARIEAEREREREQLYNRHPARAWTLAAGGVGVGALVVGGVFGMRARTAQTAFDNAGCGDPSRLLDRATLATCVDNKDSGKRDATLSSVLLIGGGALLATSVVLFMIDPGNLERPDTARARVAITPTSVQMMVTW